MATDRPVAGRRTALAAAGAGLLAVLAGCGSNSTTTVVQTTTAPPTDTLTSSTTSTETTTPTTPTAHLTAFSSPSGNIGCVMSAAAVRCDIGEKSWKPPPAPASCSLDFGQGVEVGRDDAARLVCAGDTTLGAARALPYGHSSEVGEFLCTSEESGMQCGNTSTGHGFTLSREKYELF